MGLLLLLLLLVLLILFMYLFILSMLYICQYTNKSVYYIYPWS